MRFEVAQANGLLKLFNHRYRIERQKVRAQGGQFPPYAAAFTKVPAWLDSMQQRRAQRALMATSSTRRSVLRQRLHSQAAPYAGRCKQQARTRMEGHAMAFRFSRRLTKLRHPRGPIG